MVAILREPGPKSFSYEALKKAFLIRPIEENFFFYIFVWSFSCAPQKIN
jgi:hypothetical protein